MCSFVLEPTAQTPSVFSVLNWPPLDNTEPAAASIDFFKTTRYSFYHFADWHKTHRKQPKTTAGASASLFYDSQHHGNANSKLATASASNLQVTRPDRTTVNTVSNHNNHAHSSLPKTAESVRSFHCEDSVRWLPILLHTVLQNARQTQLSTSCVKTLPVAVPQCNGPAGGTRDTRNILNPRCCSCCCGYSAL